MTVDVSLGSVAFADNGSASVSDVPDPEWAGRYQLESTHLSLGPGTYLDDKLSIRMPSGAAPDDYYMGLLVTPELSGPGSVKVVTRIATLVDFQVPGVRHSSLRVDSMSVPRWVFGSHMTVKTVVSNPGHSFVTTWGEVHYKTLGGAEQIAAFPGRYVVAPGHKRTLEVPIHLGAGLGPLHVESIVFYNSTPSTVTQLERSGSGWEINPPFLPAVPLVAVGMIVAWRVGRRRARRRPAVPAPAHA